MFKLAILISASLVTASALGQTAEDYFHGGAQHYVHGRKPEAKAQITEGLAKFPDDPKLRGLFGLLKEEEKKQQNQQKQDQKDQQQQEKQDQQEQDQQKQDQQKQQSAQDQKDQQKKEQERQEKQKQEQERQKQKAEQQKQQQEQQKKQGEQDKQPGEPQEGEEIGQTQAGLLTPQQARQILDAQKSDEKMLPVDLQKVPDKPGAPRRIKDW